MSSLFSLPIPVFADDGPAITGGTNITAETDQYIPITGITITGDSEDPIPVSLSVPHGSLSMTTTTGLTFTGSQTGSRLSFSGNKADLNAALATLRYKTSRAETVTLTATLTPSGLVYFPGNGHMYEVVNNGDPLSWNDAKVAAESRTMNGATGYLATITSQAENDYLLGKLTGDGWFGASDAGTEGDWKWVTGPETGTSFWSGQGDGHTVGGLFANWNSSEPNDSQSNEDCAQFYSNGNGWNDLPCDGAYLDYYVVEYGAPGDLPVSPSTTSLDITTAFPTPVTVPVDACQQFIDEFSDPSAHRYDNIVLTQNIDCAGHTLSPLFGGADEDESQLSFRGTFNGNGHTISTWTLPVTATTQDYSRMPTARRLKT